MLILEEAQYTSNLGCEDCSSRTMHARLIKNSIPKTLWEKGYGEKSTWMTLTNKCSKSWGDYLWVPCSRGYLQLWALPSLCTSLTWFVGFAWCIGLHPQCLLLQYLLDVKVLGTEVFSAWSFFIFEPSQATWLNNSDNEEPSQSSVYGEYRSHRLLPLITLAEI